MTNPYSTEKYGRTGSSELFKRHLVMKCGLTPKQADKEIKLVALAEKLGARITPFFHQHERLYRLRTKKQKERFIDGIALNADESLDFLLNWQRSKTL